MKKQKTETYQAFSNDFFGTRNKLVSSFAPYVHIRMYNDVDIHPDTPIAERPEVERVLDLTFLGTDMVLLASTGKYSSETYRTNITFTYPEIEKDEENVEFVKKTLVEKLGMTGI